MDTTYPTRPNRHELSNRRDEPRSTQFFKRPPASGTGRESNSFLLVVQRGIDAAAADCRFGLFKFAPIDLATSLFSEFRKKFFAPNLSLVQLKHQQT